jgi:hypothetical protein
MIWILNTISDCLSLVIDVYGASVDYQDHAFQDGPSSGLNNETGVYRSSLLIEEREAFVEALQSLDLVRWAASMGVQNLSNKSNGAKAFWSSGTPQLGGYSRAGTY